MSSDPPPVPPPGGGPGDAEGPPQGTPAEGGTRSPQDSMTRYDEARDAYHCSYGPPEAALTVWHPERELMMRLDRHTGRVIGFSIPQFSAWVKRHGNPDGSFEVGLPERVALERVEGQSGG